MYHAMLSKVPPKVVRILRSIGKYKKRKTEEPLKREKSAKKDALHD